MCWAHKEELEKLKMLTEKLWHTVPTWLTLTTICKYLDVWLTLSVHLNQMGLKHGLGNEVFPSFIVKYYNCTYTRKKILCLILNLRPPNLIMFTLSQLRNLWFVLFCFVLFCLFYFYFRGILLAERQQYNEAIKSYENAIHYRPRLAGKIL